MHIGWVGRNKKIKIELKNNFFFFKNRRFQCRRARKPNYQFRLALASGLVLLCVHIYMTSIASTPPPPPRTWSHGNSASRESDHSRNAKIFAALNGVNDGIELQFDIHCNIVVVCFVFSSLYMLWCLFYMNCCPYSDWCETLVVLQFEHTYVTLHLQHWQWL